MEVEVRLPLTCRKLWLCIHHRPQILIRGNNAIVFGSADVDYAYDDRR
jgi:hypothetical protein